MNQSIHTIDLMLHLMGDVKAVSASGGLEAHQGIEVEDIAVAIVEFKSGTRGVIQASTACYSNSGLPASIHICGDQGSIMMVDDKFSIWDLKHSMPEDDEILRKHGIYEDRSEQEQPTPKQLTSNGINETLRTRLIHWIKIISHLWTEWRVDGP